MIYFRALVFISVKTSIVNDYFILLDIHAIIQKGEENVGFPLLRAYFCMFAASGFNLSSF